MIKCCRKTTQKPKKVQDLGHKDFRISKSFLFCVKRLCFHSIGCVKQVKGAKSYLLLGENSREIESDNGLSQMSVFISWSVLGYFALCCGRCYCILCGRSFYGGDFL